MDYNFFLNSSNPHVVQILWFSFFHILFYYHVISYFYHLINLNFFDCPFPKWFWERERERETHTHTHTTPPLTTQFWQCYNAHINTRSMLQNFAQLPITYPTSVMAPNHSFYRHPYVFKGGSIRDGSTQIQNLI
jgi:hypothetical protein